MQSRKTRREKDKEYLLNLKKDMRLEEIREKKTIKILKKMQGAEGNPSRSSSNLSGKMNNNTSSRSYGGAVNMFQYMNTAGMMMQKQKKDGMGSLGRPAGGSRVGSGTAGSFSTVRRRKQVRAVSGGTASNQQSSVSQKAKSPEKSVKKS